MPAMVRLDAITTGHGDGGESRLADGSLLPKDAPIFAAIGAIDECNCALGLAACEAVPVELAAQVRQLQNDLFDLGADLATPIGVDWEARAIRIRLDQVERLERWTAEHGRALAPLTSFILPGGSRASAALHQARALARRAECAAIAAWPTLPAVAQRADRLPLIYLNRLSDLLFQLARRCNRDGAEDVLWQPGARLSTEAAGEAAS